MSGAPGLTLLLGRAHSGKSARLRQALAAHQANGERAILIVAEQYTFETERALSDALGGLIGVQVFSFERLSERVLALSGCTRPFLDAQGCRMLIKRAALARQDALTVLARAASLPGFADEMRGLFSEFKRSGLSPDDLLSAADRLENDPALSGKLRDAAVLYADTEAALSKRYLTADDAMHEACALLPDSFVRGVPVYIDGIDSPNQQLYSLLAALMRTAGGVTAALRVDRAAPPDADVFAPDEATGQRLSELAASMGLPVRMIDCAPLPGRAAPALKHLERNLFASPIRPFSGVPDGVTLFGASNRVREAAALCAAVEARARQGVRYRDMTVIMSDPDAYGYLVRRAFSRRGIPYFFDSKRPVTGHAAADAALSAVRAVAGGFSSDDVLRLAKTGYTGADAGDIEALELYLLRTGLSGSALCRPFTGGSVPEGAARARAAVMEPLIAFRTAFSGADTAGKTRALYEYLRVIDLAGQLSRQAEALRQAGRIDRMEEHAEVWRALSGLFDQLVQILGDVRLSGRAYAAVLEEGLAGCTIGVIPGTADAVLLGDTARTKSRSVKALFMIGCNEGKLPGAHTDDTLISDEELRRLAALGLPVWNSSAQRAAAELIDLYSVFSRAEESLFVSCAFTGDNEELAPSPLMLSIAAVFPGICQQSDLDAAEALPLSPADGVSMLARDLREYYAGENAGVRIPSLFTCLGETPGHDARAARLKAACARRGRPASLGASLAMPLYDGAKRMSASRLEQFNACPYKHFIRYGLRAADEKVYEEKATDLGSFYHAALEAFVRTVTQRGLDWRKLTDASCDALMDELLPDVIAAHNEGIFLSNMRLRATLFLLIDTLKAGARAIARQLSAGAFTPLGAECRFGPGEAFPPLPIRTEDGGPAYLSGIIDRIDTAGIDGEAYYRVVDYKTGGHAFDFAEVLDGLTLQLPLYLAAAARAGGGRAGLYYMALSPALPDDTGRTEAAFRLVGLTLSDPSVVLASDAALLSGGADVLDHVKSDGKSFSGSLCSAEEMRALVEKALEKAGQTVREMRGGRIAASPAEQACKRCDYRSICRFDPALPGCRARKARRISREEFFGEGGGKA